jgi:hypothetical protein
MDQVAPEGPIKILRAFRPFTMLVFLSADPGPLGNTKIHKGAALRGGGGEGGRGSRRSNRAWERPGGFLGGGACCFSTGMTTASNSDRQSPEDTPHTIMVIFGVVATQGQLTLEVTREKRVSQLPPPEKLAKVSQVFI